MLLRRITQHVKNQNWFAVFVDFLIVVVGVFIGIQVANWNETRLTEKESESAKASLIADLQNDRDVYKVRKKYYQEVKQRMINFIQALEQDYPDSTEEQWLIIYNGISAGSMWPFSPSGQIYTQLVNSGKLDLVSDVDVQRQMRDYYRDAALEIGQTVKFDSKFREHSRSLVNWKVSEYEREQCNRVVGLDPAKVISGDTDYIQPCPAPKLSLEIQATAKEMYEAESIRQLANRALYRIGTILVFIEYFDDEAKELIALLENQ